MADYVETQTKDGSTLRIEVSDAPKGGTGFGGLQGGDEPPKTLAYDETLDTIRACANGIIDTIQSLEAPPAAASIDFGIKVDGKAGAMVAKSIGEGQFKISLSWKRDDPDEDDD